MLHTWGRWGALLLVLASATQAWARPKSDTVWTDRGDRVICEIVQVSQGLLKVKTYDMGTLTIDWLHVSALHTSYYYRVEPKSGGRFFGAPWLDSLDGLVRVRRASDTLIFLKSDVVEILPIYKNFWARMDGSFSLGFSYTKASEVAQLSLDWTNRYTLEKDLVDFKASIITTSTGQSDTVAQNQNLSVTYYRLIRKRFNASASGAYQRNDELGLKRRTIGTVTGGVNPISTNLHTLLLSLGAAINSELGTSDTSVVTQSAEGVVKASYSLFRYDTPKANLDVTTAYYPSITDKGRQRLDFNANLSYELVKDFYFKLSYYTNLDSKPATQDASKADYGIVTSISYTY